MRRRGRRFSERRELPIGELPIAKDRVRMESRLSRHYVSPGVRVSAASSSTK
jgi:hypothetical protein